MGETVGDHRECGVMADEIGFLVLTHNFQLNFGQNPVRLIRQEAFECADIALQNRNQVHFVADLNGTFRCWIGFIWEKG